MTFFFRTSYRKLHIIIMGKNKYLVQGGIYLNSKTISSLNKPVNKSIKDIIKKKSAIKKNNKKDKLSIILVTNEYPTDERITPGGGIGTVYYEMANGLAELGHDVSVITLTRIKEACYYENGVHVHKIFPIIYQPKEQIEYKKGLLKSFYWSKAVSKKIFSILREKNVDIIQFPELSGQAYFFLKDIKESSEINNKKRNFKNLVRLHSFTKYYRKSRNILTQTEHQKLELERITLKNCDLVISSCNETIETAKKTMNIDNLKYEIVPNSIDSTFFRPKKEKHNLDNNKYFVFGYVGKLRYAKGVDNIIKAFSVIAAENHKVELLLIGREQNYAYSLIDNLRGDIKERIKVIRQIPRNELVNYYQTFNCFILASRYESSPNTLLEAMSCGVPAIASNVGCVNEILGNSPNIIFNSENTEELIKAMKIMLKKPHVRQKASLYNRQKVEKNYSRKIIAQRYVSLYKKLLNN